MLLNNIKEVVISDGKSISKIFLYPAGSEPLKKHKESKAEFVEVNEEGKKYLVEGKENIIQIGPETTHFPPTTPGTKKHYCTLKLALYNRQINTHLQINKK